MWLKRASIWRDDNNRLIKFIDVCYLFLYRNDNYYQLSWWDVEVLLKIDACGFAGIKPWLCQFGQGTVEVNRNGVS